MSVGHLLSLLRSRGFSTAPPSTIEDYPHSFKYIISLCTKRIATHKKWGSDAHSAILHSKEVSVFPIILG